MTDNYLKYKQQGLSLVELMVALTLGIILTSALVQVFVGNRQTENVEQALARVQESGRFALDMIAADVRMAGYYGCSLNLPDDGTPMVSVVSNGNNSDTNLAGFVETAIRGFDKDSGGNWSPTLATDISGTVGAARNLSDVISIHFGQETGSSLTANIAAANNIPIDDNSGGCLTQNDRAIIASCTDVPDINAMATVFTITNTPACSTTQSLSHSSTSNSSGNLAASYKTGDRVLRLINRTYYVKDTGRRNSANDAIYSLYRLEFNKGAGTEQELIEGVEYLQILYGEELDDGNLRYVTAANVLNPVNIVSVRIALLVQSVNPIRNDADPVTYSVLDENITPAGRVMRRLFTTTVKIRNRAQRIL